MNEAGRGFSVESEMSLLAAQHRLRVEERPILVDYDVPLKRNPVAQGMDVVTTLLRLVGQARPLLFLSVPGLLMVLAGLLLGMQVVAIYQATLELAVGYALLVVLLVEAGLLSLFVGIVLHTVRALFLEHNRHR